MNNPDEIIVDKQVRMIVVEDHDIYRKFMTKLVERRVRFKVVATASNGIEAIEAIRNTPADLIILDLSLPGLDGFSVLRESKKLSSAKVLVVTMHADKNYLEEALNAGADGFCLKDRTIQELERAILDTLDGKRPCYYQVTP